jgi:hypothetical protein
MSDERRDTERDGAPGMPARNVGNSDGEPRRGLRSWAALHRPGGTDSAGPYAGPERRADVASPAPGSRGLPGRKSRRDLLRTMRKPLIGLTMAGAALPLINAGADAPPPRTADADPEIVPSGAEVGDEVAERWAETEEATIRAETVEGAMVRYGIAQDLAEDIYDAAVEEGIEPDLAFGLINTESTFRERAVSSVGARGLTQVMPRTAAWLEPGTTAEDLFRRDTNLRLGFRYLNDMIDKYKGDVRLALLAYNRGPGTVDRVLRRGGNPDNGYADKVLRG